MSLVNPVYANNVNANDVVSTNLSKIYDQIQREVSSEEPVAFIKSEAELRAELERKIREKMPSQLVLIFASGSVGLGVAGVLLILAFCFLIVDSVSDFQFFVFGVLSLAYVSVIFAGVALFNFSRNLTPFFFELEISAVQIN